MSEPWFCTLHQTINTGPCAGCRKSEVNLHTGCAHSVGYCCARDNAPRGEE